MCFKGVILAGGTGTRLLPLIKVINKHLLPVYDEPMIYKPIRTLVNSGITEITVVLGGESVGAIKRLLGCDDNFDVKFSFVYQEQAGGIAEALYLAKEIVKGSRVAILLGDNIFEDNFSEEVNEFENSEDCDCVLFLKKVQDPERFGIAEIKK